MTGKTEIREKNLKKRRDLDKNFRQQADSAINRQLLKLSVFQSKKLIGAYATDGTEPDLGDFMRTKLADGSRIYLPRFNASLKTGYEMVEIRDLDKDLVLGKYGIPEPSPAIPAADEEDFEQILWLIPGVAFDETGSRLGRGGGVYDRLLKNHHGLKIGVFYECQKCGSLPLEKHDCQLDLIVTEKKVYERGGNILNNEDKTEMEKIIL
jgi:5-formyltetrahydrofolate cyclo-ligase